MRGRPGIGRLLASSSVAALLIGSGAPPAVAACVVINAPFDNPAPNTIQCIQLNNAAIAGNISNEGTITGTISGAISLTAGTIAGQIVDAGVVLGGGIAVDQASQITGHSAIQVTGPTFAGGVANAGTVTGNVGIVVGTFFGANFVTTFGGGISNSGTIMASNVDIILANVITFTGGITNSGTVTGSPSNAGIFVRDTSIFSGDIVNQASGSITAAAGEGISVNRVPTFLGGITNLGTVSAGSSGIGVFEVATFTGTISNGGTLSGATAISIIGSTIVGRIVDSGVLSGSNIGIAIDGGSEIVAAATAIAVTGPSLAGGVSNAGIVTAGNVGILLAGVTSFGGGVINTGTVTAGQSAIAVANVATFAGNISNGGTLSAANGIVISGSTIAGSIIDTGNVLATTHGIAIDRASMVTGSHSAIDITGPTFTGGIVNAGTLSATAGGGDGIFVFQTSTFTGGIVNTGTIAAGNRAIFIGAVPTFAGNISNAGTLSAANGIVVGAGVTFTGGAAIVNSGAITGTTAAIDVSAATSPVTIDQTAGEITGAINLSAHADVLNITGGAISGNVVGQGTDTVNFALGSGTFTYASPLAMTALSLVNFNSGTVVVNGSIGGTTIDVNAGAAVAGAGTLAGAVTIMSGATLMPGQPLGTLDVTGSVTFNAGSTYAVHITPSANSATGITGAPGTAAINGGTVLALPQLGHYNATTYTIATASGGVSGAFTAVGVAAPFTFTGTETLTYNADDVFLNLGAGYALLAPAGTNQNQQNVVNGINNFILGSGSNPPPQFANLANLSGPTLLNALSQLSGENNAGFFQGALQAGNSFLGLLLNPYVDGSGFVPAIPFAAEEQPALPDAALAFARFDKARPRDATLGSVPRFRIWGAAYGGSGSIDGNAAVGSQKTTARDAAFAAGIDYLLSPNTTVGFALAGGGTSWGLSGGLGDGRSDMFQAGVYARQRFGDAYLSGALAYNFHDVTTNRTVTIAGTDMLQARFQANGLGARLESGYHFATPYARVTPYGAVQVQSIFLPAYGEVATAGSNQFALNFASQVATTTRTELGAWLDKSELLGNGARMTLYGRLAWAHDFGDTPSASAIFQALPGSNFIVNGAVPARDGALLTGAAQYSLANGWSFLAKFDGEFSSTTSIYSGTGVVRKAW